MVSLAVRLPNFWLLSRSFFVCGTPSKASSAFTSSCISESGIAEVTVASALALMDVMNSAARRLGLAYGPLRPA
jgi:hypothetical protein